MLAMFIIFILAVFCIFLYLSSVLHVLITLPKLLVIILAATGISIIGNFLILGLRILFPHLLGSYQRSLFKIKVWILEMKEWLASFNLSEIKS